MDQTDDFKERTLAEALTVAANRRGPTRERAMAARIAAELLDFVDWNEARAANVLRALHAALEGCADPFGVVDALVDVVRRKESRRPERVAPAIARLAEGAHRRGFMMALHVLVVAMLDHDVWSAFVQTEWVEAVVRWGVDRVGSRDTAGEVLHLYLSRFGVKQKWLRGVVQDCPKVLRSSWLDFPTRQALHYLGPTSEGWSYFAELASEDVLSPWDAARFGDELSTAMSTVLLALSGAQAENASGTSVVLAEWLSLVAAPG